MLLPATTTVALRAMAALAVADTTAVPDPVRPPVTLAHVDADDEVHVHAEVVVTATDFVLAAFVKLTEIGDTVKVHPDAWLTETLLPATTSVAVRLLPLLAVRETTAVPDPVRLPVTLAHVVGEDAVHEQVDAVLTVIEAVAAAFEKLSAVGDTA